jgi:hypothetical protein
VLPETIPLFPAGYWCPVHKKKISFGTFRCFARDGTRTIVSGAARRAKVLLSAPSNSQPFARHVRRRCIREFVRAG